MKLNKLLVRYKRLVAKVFILLFVSELGIPAVVMASSVTKSGSHTDFWGYNSGNNSELVSLSTGALNYAVPITSVPQYPMSIAYSSSDGLNREAGMFGLGFSGFPGAINRSRMGLPDDLDGGEVSYDFSTQTYWKGSIGGMYSVDLLSKFLKPEVVQKINGNVSLSASISLDVGFDNYAGAFMKLGFGLNGGARFDESFKLGNVSGGIGANLGLDFESSGDGGTLSYNVGGGINVTNNIAGSFLKARPSLQFAISGNSDGVRDYYAKAELEVNDGLFFENLSQEFKSSYSSNTENSRFYLPSGPNVSSGEIKSTSISASVPIAGGFSVNGKFSITNFGNETRTMKAYGFAHLGKASRTKNVDEITDFTIEGENPYAEGNKLNQTPHLQYDNFNVSAAGISGSFRYYQKQYGEVSRVGSRVQSREYTLGLPPIRTVRQESYPYSAVTKTSYNKDINILDFLTEENKDDNDFDNIFYRHEVVKSLNESDRRFGEVAFRMIGDLAGDYTENINNIGEPLKQEVVRMEGSKTKYSAFFIGVERNSPMYYTDFSGESKNHLNKVHAKMNVLDEEQSSNIKSYTIGEMRALATSVNTQMESMPNMPATECFYNQYVVNSNGAGNGVAIQGSDDLSPLSMASIFNTKDNNKNGYYDKLIGAFEVENTDGMRYFFTIPVFEKKVKSVTIQGKGLTPPNVSGDDYHSFDDKDRQKSVITEDFWYPYSWLMTAVVGPDYIDNDDIPGPSDGDLGYWVKFKYVKTSSAYHWRTPFNGMNHSTGDLENVKDDNYSVEEGYKEIYYPVEIESASHITRYNLFKRMDGVDVKNQLVVGNPQNNAAWVTEGYQPGPDPAVDILGSNYLYGVSSVDLYKKHDNNNVSKLRTLGTELPYKKVRSTEFVYDYSSWPGVYNNLSYFGKTVAGIGDVSDVWYENNGALDGKLTLKSVRDVVYDEQDNKQPFPDHSFEYNQSNASEYNERNVDVWGNYKKDAFNIVADKNYSSKNRMFQSAYTEVSKNHAKIAAETYKLKVIHSPTGGDIAINYAPKGYSSVQGKLPHVMRKIVDVSRVEVEGTYMTRLKVDITDIAEDMEDPLSASLEGLFDDNFHYTDGDNNGKGDRGEYLRSVHPIAGEYKKLYGEVGFYLETDQVNNRPSLVRVQSEKGMDIGNYGSVLPETQGSETRYYQLIDVYNPDNSYPFYDAFESYMLSESPHHRAAKIKFNKADRQDEVDQAVNVEMSSLEDAFYDMIGNVTGMFKSSEGIKDNLEDAFGYIGDKMVPELSYLRTPIYKGKYTGSVVTEIQRIDNFKFASDDLENRFTTRYYYDNQFNNQGISNGVCSIESEMGPSAVIDMSKQRGMGFQTAPQIYMKGVGVKNGVLDQDVYASVDIPGESRGKGITIHEFYTPDEPGYSFSENYREKDYKGGPKRLGSTFLMFATLSYIKFRIKIFKREIWFKVPFPIFLNSKYHQSREFYTSSSTFVDRSDLFGRPKYMEVRDENGSTVNSVTYEYAEPNETVNVITGDYDTLSNIKAVKPGSVEQVWGESYAVKESANAMMILFLTADSKFKYIRTVSRNVHIPAILKKITYNDREKETVVHNELFHAYTGEPLQTRTVFPDGVQNITRKYPAYWKNEYAKMVATNEEGTNQFNNLYKSITYLKQKGDNNAPTAADVLGASEITYTDEWKVTDSYVLEKKYSSTNNFSFEPVEVSSGKFWSKHEAGLNASASIHSSGKLVPRHKEYRVQSQLVPRFNIDPVLGTYLNYQDYVDTDPDNSNWIKVSTNNLYESNTTQLVEVQNVEGKYGSKQQVMGIGIPLMLAGNAPYNYACYSGGEYFGFSNQQYVSLDPHIKLGAAKHFVKQDCASVITTEEEILSDDPFHIKNDPNIPEDDEFTAKIIQIPAPALGELFKASVVINNEDQTKQVSRVLAFEQITDGTVRALTNFGEPFDGFFQIQENDGSITLYFKPNQFADFDFITQPNGITYTDFLGNWSDFQHCFNSKTVMIPVENCFTDVHTGTYGYYLESNQAGMIFEIPLDEYDVAKHADIFEGMVWVHQSAASNVKMVAKIISGTSNDIKNEVGLFTAEKQLGNASIQTPEWKLLKLGFQIPDISEYTPSSTDKLVFYIENQSNGVVVLDDYRVSPAGSGWQGTLSDLQFGREEYQLNNDHFAAKIMYDPFGRLSELQKEVENIGFVTVQKKRYGFQKH